MYTTKEKIEKYLMTDISADFNAQVSDWISAVELYINNYTGKIDGFEEDAIASAKYFDGNGERELQIDEFTTISNVEIYDETLSEIAFILTENSDYLVYPYNTYPKYKLILTPSSTIGAFYSGPRRIKVTAKWGNNTTVPKDIELAATILVAEIIRQGRDGGLVISENLGDYSSSFETFVDEAMRITNVRKILDMYKIYEV